MNLLLDTHTLIWFLEDDPTLSPVARAAICHADNLCFVSDATAWEMAIKFGSHWQALSSCSRPTIGLKNSMTATEIQKALRNVPFQPFELITGDGGRYQVPTSDHAAVSPTGRFAAIFHDDDSVSHLDVFLVTALHYPAPARKKAKH